MNEEIYYRLALPEEWDSACASGEVPRRQIDIDDGYFHLSTGTQLIETANLHFAAHQVLVALAFRAETLADHIKMELAPKRQQYFPHYYGALQTKDVAEVLTLEKAEGGSFGVTARAAVAQPEMR